MARTVNCLKLKREAEGLDYPPYPGELGTRIWQSISKEAWEEWKQVQTRLVNENRLNLADSRAPRTCSSRWNVSCSKTAASKPSYVPPSA